MFEVNQFCSSPAELHPKSKVCCSSLMLWGCFQRQGLEDWSGLRDRWMEQSTAISSMKTCSTAFRTSDWAKGSPSNMTMTLKTQPRQHRSGLGAILWIQVRVLTWTLLNISGGTWKWPSTDGLHPNLPSWLKGLNTYVNVIFQFLLFNK